MMPPSPGDNDAVFSVDFSPNGKRVASGNKGGLLCIWEVATGRLAQQPLRGHSDAILAVAFSPNGSLLASASSDTTIRLWSTESGNQISVMTDHTDDVSSITFSHDGKTLASASNDNTIRLWSLPTGEPLGIPLFGLSGLLDPGRSLAFAPDGSWLAIASSLCGPLRVDYLGSQQPVISRITDLGQCYSLAFSSDRSMIVFSDGSSIRSCTLGSPPVVTRTRFIGHAGTIPSITFSRQGRFFCLGLLRWYRPDLGCTRWTQHGSSAIAGTLQRGSLSRSVSQWYLHCLRVG